MPTLQGACAANRAFDLSQSYRSSRVIGCSQPETPEVFPRLELGGEQLAQGVEAGAARAAQRRRVIVHEAPVQKSRRKPTPLWRGGL